MNNLKYGRERLEGIVKKEAVEETKYSNNKVMIDNMYGYKDKFGVQRNM